MTTRKTTKKTAKKTTNKTAKKTSKKAPTRKKTAPKRIQIDDELVDKIVVQLVSRSASERTIRSTLSTVPRTTLDAHLAEARTRLARAVQLDRDAEVGIAIEQLQTIILAASQTGKLTEMIQARKELSKLQGLYPSGVAAGPAPSSSEQLTTIEQIEAHLRPLGIAPADYPIEGVARVAADTIRRLQVDRGAG